MTKLKFLAAAAVMTSLAAAPALAKDAQTPGGKQTVKVQKKMNKQARAPVSPTWRNDRTADVQYDRGYDNRGYNGGFWPGAVAAGIVGGAVNTAGAIATAPFRDDYAYDSAYDNSYAYSPATTYRDDDDFVPGAVATNIVGGAVNTAGAIATAPFRNTYAYDNSYAYSPAPVYRSTYNSDWNSNWARRQSVEQGGFICTPGTSYTNEYGYTQLCQ